MRTHESVLLANFETTQNVEKGASWHARKYKINGQEVLERRVVIVKCPDGSVNINSQINALGSFHEFSSVNLTKEQIEFLKEQA